MRLVVHFNNLNLGNNVSQHEPLPTLLELMAEEEKEDDDTRRKKRKRNRSKSN